MGSGVATPGAGGAAFVVIDWPVGSAIDADGNSMMLTPAVGASCRFGDQAGVNHLIVLEDGIGCISPLDKRLLLPLPAL